MIYSALPIWSSSTILWPDIMWYTGMWSPIRPVEINQYDITMATHYHITMGNNVARDVHCEITMVNDVARDIHCDITMSNGIAMCTYHGITLYNDVAMNLFFYVFSALCLITILLWLVCNKNKNKFMFDQYGLKNTFIVLFPTQTQLMCSPQTDQTLTCSCYTP